MGPGSESGKSAVVVGGRPTPGPGIGGAGSSRCAGRSGSSTRWPGGPRSTGARPGYRARRRADPLALLLHLAVAINSQVSAALLGAVPPTSAASFGAAEEAGMVDAELAAVLAPPARTTSSCSCAWTPSLTTSPRSWPPRCPGTGSTCVRSRAGPQPTPRRDVAQRRHRHGWPLASSRGCAAEVTACSTRPR